MWPMMFSLVGTLLLSGFLRIVCSLCSSSSSPRICVMGFWPLNFGFSDWPAATVHACILVAATAFGCLLVDSQVQVGCHIRPFVATFSIDGVIIAMAVITMLSVLTGPSSIPPLSGPFKLFSFCSDCSWFIDQWACIEIVLNEMAKISFMINITNYDHPAYF